eukprot:TRINITY_DN4832_c0_g1_i1.p1 TRINITY_DN4832_c0_g1~~TRINITY_DN4832_c0_g1_i1.p1  ORF type:complete len:337 (+),score=-1.34 TRINITY_DN4832_c0_g1_i1:27-1037(+)
MYWAHQKSRQKRSRQFASFYLNFTNNMKIYYLLFVLLIINLLVASYYAHRFYFLDPLDCYASAKQVYDISKHEYPTRILIFVTTTPEYLHTRGVNVICTWMRHANILNPNLGIRVVLAVDSNIPQQFNIPTLNIKRIPSTNYKQLPQKVFAAFTQVWEEYGHYDYFMKADDDVFINVEKLSKIFHTNPYLNPNNIEYFGYYEPGLDIPLCWGGPGYIFSRATLGHLYPYIQECEDKFRISEDISVWQCLNHATSQNKAKFVGCQHLYNSTGTEFMHLYPFDKNWNYWNDSQQEFTLDHDHHNIKWGFGKAVTIHSVKPEATYPTDINMFDLERFYG